MDQSKIEAIKYYLQNEDNTSILSFIHQQKGSQNIDERYAGFLNAAEIMATHTFQEEHLFKYLESLDKQMKKTFFIIVSSIFEGINISELMYVTSLTPEQANFYISNLLSMGLIYCPTPNTFNLTKKGQKIKRYIALFSI